MNERNYVGAYWGSRKETADQCARRVAMLLAELPRCDGSLSRWYEKGRSAKDARRQVEIDEVTLRGLLDRGRNRRDTDGSVIEDLGYRVSLWNGDEEGEADLSVKCGSCPPAASTWTPNSLVLNLPAGGLAFERAHKESTALCVLGAAVRAFEPEWAIVTSHGLREVVPKAEPVAPTVGWLTYFARSREGLPLLPSGARVVDLADLGSVVIAMEERPTVTNATHVSRIKEIWELLSRAGFLRPSMPRA